jgi:hypothetical protein
MKSAILLVSLCAAGYCAVDTLIKPLDTIVVRGRHVEQGKVNINKIERLVGRSDELNNLIYFQPSVARVPEAGSLMLVQGDNYYDNSYYVNGIPVFLLSQFYGQVFIDRSVVSLTTANDVSLETQGIAGRYTGASGSVLSLTPTMKTGKGSGGMALPELAMQYGTLGADLTLKLPFHRIKNYYEITARPSNTYSIRTQDILFGAEPNMGLAIPGSYDNLQIHGIQKSSRYTVDEVVIAGRDNYAVEMEAIPAGVMGTIFKVKEKNIPWGIAVVSIRDTNESPAWKVSAGGSAQSCFEGKLLGSRNPLLSVHNQNAAWCLEKMPSSLQRPGTSIVLRLTSEVAQWEGSLNVRRETAKSILTSAHFLTPIYTDSVVLSRKGLRGSIAGQGSYSKELPNDLRLGLQVNGGVFLAGMKGFLDPGVSLLYERGSLSAGGSVGIVSSQPDIRGLPSERYARKVIRTYRADITASEKVSPLMTLSLNLYAKLKDHVPQKSLEALSPLWDESRGGPGRATGGTLTMDLKAPRNLRLWTSMFVSKSVVDGKGGPETSEWEIPWTLKSVLSYSFFKDFVRLYAIGNYCKGLTYRNLQSDGGELFWGDIAGRVPPYKSIDLKCEFSYEIPKSEWYIRQFDCYLLATNVTHESNIREYYWDDGLNKQPVTLAYGSYYMGARVVVRF